MIDAIGMLPLNVIAPMTGWKERYAVAPWTGKLEAKVVYGLT